MSIAVQTAVGEVGEKATTELSYDFNSMVNCGNRQFAATSTGIFLLNDPNSSEIFTKYFTLSNSDYGIKNKKRYRYIYIQIELYTIATLTVSVKPNNGDWINKTVIVKKPGLKTISFTIKREGCKGNYHSIKFSCNQYFRVHKIFGLCIVKSLGLERL